LKSDALVVALAVLAVLAVLADQQEEREGMILPAEVRKG